MVDEVFQVLLVLFGSHLEPLCYRPIFKMEADTAFHILLSSRKHLTTHGLVKSGHIHGSPRTCPAQNTIYLNH